MLNKKITVSCKWIAGYLMTGYCNVDSIEYSLKLMLMAMWVLSNFSK